MPPGEIEDDRPSGSSGWRRFFTSPRRGEVDVASATAGEGDARFPEWSRPPHPALRADPGSGPGQALSPPGRGEDGALRKTAASAGHALSKATCSLLDLALPPQCLACEKPVVQAGGLCVGCWSALKPIERPYCERLGTPFPADFGPGLLSPAAIAKPPAFDRARAVARFDGTARELVHRLKYGDAVHLARPMGAMMARAGHELLVEGALLCPVPLHRGRLWSRRFNQSALLARAVAKVSGAELRLDALARVKATRPQVGLTAAQRAENLSGAFRVDKAAVAGRRVVLVDDVVTTGATVDRLSRLARRAGAASVDVLTFAVVVKEA